MMTSSPDGWRAFRSRETKTRTAGTAPSGGFPAHRSSAMRATETTRLASARSTASTARSRLPRSARLRPSWITSNGPKMWNSTTASPVALAVASAYGDASHPSSRPHQRSYRVVIGP